MTAREFVSNIRANQPERIHLENRLNTETLHGILSDAHISDSDSNYQEHGNEILNLLHNFDLSRLNVYDITFDHDLEVYKDFLFFGWDTIGDRLGYHIPSGEVISYYLHGDCVHFKCAMNDRQFLQLFFELYLLLKGRLETDDEQAKDRIRENFWSKTTSTVPDTCWKHYERFLVSP
ncbi:MAG: hypothetical protein LBE37_10320 [Sphingobacterium sp.]|jgi:hypothetical protein|nr:hypothetical protein [Sphingobacterium sp.]